MTEITLYQYPPSYHSQIVRLCLTESNIKYRKHRIDIGPRMENYDPWYVRIHPEMVVPALDHDGRIVTQTLRIVRYIDRKLSNSTLTPPSMTRSADVEEWTKRILEFPIREFSYGVLVPYFIARRIFALRKRTIRRYMETNPNLQDAYRARLQDIEQWEEISLNPDKIDLLESRLKELLDELGRALDDGRWVVGNEYTRVDTVLTVLLARLELLTGTSYWSNGRRPNMRSYYERVRERPSFKEANLWNSKRPLRLSCLFIHSLWKRLMN